MVDRPGQDLPPDWGDGHHPYSDGAELYPSGGSGGLVWPAGDGVEAVGHAGGGILHRRGSGALARPCKPGIFNADQGSQFARAAFAGLLLEQKIATSMDGRGACGGTTYSSSGCGVR